MAVPRVRIVVVGDVHDEWNAVQDGKVLQALQPDLVLFTGDFGDENVELVEHVSNLNFPKAVILGNHDCWYTAPFHGSHSCVSSPKHSNAVDLQLQSLGESHVGYKRKDFPELKLSVIGGRPFSSGGKRIGPSQDVVSTRFGINGMWESAMHIANLALTAPTEHTLIFLAHNGPRGLGSHPEDICGKDWSLSSFGDHGDPDLEEALKIVKERGTHKVQLVIFGHMHRTLAHNRGFRKMLVVGQDKTIYVNAAVVPRVQNVTGISASYSNQGQVTERNFTSVDLIYGEVENVTELWVRIGDTVINEQETKWFSSSEDPTSRIE